MRHINTKHSKSLVYSSMAYSSRLRLGLHWYEYEYDYGFVCKGCIIPQTTLRYVNVTTLRAP